MILGDSLLVMTSPAEKEAMKGKVQCIYMHPPYGIKFNSNWQPSTKSRDVKDGATRSRAASFLSDAAGRERGRGTDAIRAAGTRMRGMGAPCRLETQIKTERCIFRRALTA